MKPKDVRARMAQLDQDAIDARNNYEIQLNLIDTERDKIKSQCKHPKSARHDFSGYECSGTTCSDCGKLL